MSADSSRLYNVHSIDAEPVLMRRGLPHEMGDLRSSASTNARTGATVLPLCHATNTSQVAPLSTIGTITTFGTSKCLTNLGFKEMASSLPRMARLSAMRFASQKQLLISQLKHERFLQVAETCAPGYNQRVSQFCRRFGKFRPRFAPVRAFESDFPAVCLGNGEGGIRTLGSEHVQGSPKSIPRVNSVNNLWRVSKARPLLEFGKHPNAING